MDVRELARRTVPRDSIDFRTTIAIETIGELDARLMDISPYGFQCRTSCRMVERGELAMVTLPLIGERAADIMWGLKGLFGCKFVEPIEPDLYAEMLAAIRDPAYVPAAFPPVSAAGEQRDGGIPLE
ncbi:MAG: hypothetical protein J7494_10735 [Sphingobium sp.]|nr:hypothetical protein [Sphingobium sp.]